MYSWDAWLPCHQYMTPVNETPMAIQIDDSMAASLKVISCAVRCTSRRSAMTSTAIRPMNRPHCQGCTSKLAKFCERLLASANTGENMEKLRLMVDRCPQPEVSPFPREPATPGAVRAP